jgi:Leu/Phe-tRNA-protein transferase
MNEVYTLKYTESGLIFMDGGDNCEKVVDAMIVTGYDGGFCIGLDWDPIFISRLMKAGFLVLSATLFTDEEYPEDDENPDPVDQFVTQSIDLVLPKLHLVRSVLFFENLHVKRSIRPYLTRYELRFNTDFETVIQKCIQTHGEVWLTPSLLKSIFSIQEQNAKQDAKLTTLFPTVFPQPVSFSLYRDGKLIAGEFGIICGRVYTSYSGFKEENNAGTVQMILMIRALEEAGFDFLDFGMPLDYKTDLGALNISPEQFVSIFRLAQI